MSENDSPLPRRGLLRCVGAAATALAIVRPGKRGSYDASIVLAGNVAGRSALSILGRTAIYTRKEVTWKGLYGA